MRKTAICSFLLFALAFSGRAFAQNEAPAQEANKAPEAKTAEATAHYYHLDFVLQEVGENGKPVNSRTYSCTVSTTRGEHDSVRIGSKVPITVGSGSSSQFQYVDMGVRFDVDNAHEVGNRIAMNLKAEISSFDTAEHPASDNAPPVIRNNIWYTPVLITVGKPTVVFTSDSIESKGGMQVVVMATLLQ